MLVQVNQNWFDKIEAYTNLVRQSAEIFFQELDRTVDPIIADREGILAQFHPKLLFLWRVHFEASKASESIERAISLAQGGTIQAAQVHSLMDELSLRQRKLFEILLNLILIAQHPNGNYFRHFNLKHQLKELNRQKQNAQRFYGFTSPNLNLRITQVQGRISTTESDPSFTIANCLYLDGSGNFKTTEQMLFDSLTFAEEFEKAALGFSYQEVFGAVSKDVHFSEGAHGLSQANEQKIYNSIETILSLSVCVINRVTQLYRIDGDNVPSVNSSLEAIFLDYIPNTAFAALAGTAVVGDKVLVWDEPFNRYGEVTNAITSSSTGYVGYELNTMSGTATVTEIVPSTRMSVIVPLGKELELITDAINRQIVEQSLLDGHSINEQIVIIFASPNGGNDLFFEAIEKYNLESSLFAGSAMPSAG